MSLISAIAELRKRARPSEGGGEEEEEEDDDLGSAVDDAESHAARRLRTIMATMDSAATEFVCPITQELPVDPVMAMDGRCTSARRLRNGLPAAMARVR